MMYDQQTKEANSSVPMDKEPVSAAPQDIPPKKPIGPMKLFILGAICVVIVVGGIGGYLWLRQGMKSLSENPSIVSAAKTLNLSVAEINGVSIPYSDYIEDRKILKKIYAENPETYPTFSEEEVSDQVLSRLFINALLTELGKQYQVSVTDEDLNKVKLDVLAGKTETEVESQLMTQYGLSLDQYIHKVVYPVVLEQKVQQAFAVSTDDAGKGYEEREVKAHHILFSTEVKKEATVKAQAEQVLRRIKAGEKFETLAAQYGSDDTKANGGDLGWVNRSQVVPEFGDALFALKIGELSPTLVKTEYGYHIIRADEERIVRSYMKFMDAYVRKANVRIFLPIHNPFETLFAPTSTAAGTPSAPATPEVK